MWSTGKIIMKPIFVKTDAQTRRQTDRHALMLKYLRYLKTRHSFLHLLVSIKAQLVFGMPIFHLRLLLFLWPVVLRSRVQSSLTKWGLITFLSHWISEIGFSRHWCKRASNWKFRKASEQISSNVVNLSKISRSSCFTVWVCLFFFFNCKFWFKFIDPNPCANVLIFRYSDLFKWYVYLTR
jgi:hypothetical protein